MNCSVCGSPLLFDRVVFSCSCGAYVHAYCADKHIVDAHRPELEEGYADLNGEFHPKYQPVAEPVAAIESSSAPSEVGREEEDEEEVVVDELISGEEIVVEEAEGAGDEDSDEDS